MNMDRIIEKKKWYRKRAIQLPGMALVLLVIIYILISLSNKSAEEVMLDHITVSTVKKGIFQEYISVIGTIKPIRTFYLDAVEGGRVEKIFVEAGSMVEKGDKIVKLSNTNLLMTVVNNEAMVNRAVNDLRLTRLQMEQSQLSQKSRLARIEFDIERFENSTERYRVLYKEEMMPEDIFENYEFLYNLSVKARDVLKKSIRKDWELRTQQINQLETSVRQMQKNLDLVKQQLKNLTIQAPVSGHLTSLKAEIGESKAPGERLGQIDIMEGFKIKADIDQHFINRIEEGKVGYFDFSGQTHTLTITKVYPEVKEGKFEVDLAFEGKEPPGIKRGQTPHIRIALSSRIEALLLPQGAFFYSTGGHWVYVLYETSTYAQKRPIKLGRQNPKFFEVLEGLKPGERVIISSYEKYKNSQRLMIKDNN